MSNINKHQCPSCGGSLIVDNEKQMYRCTSCGSSYDYDYFREEKLHEMGETEMSLEPLPMHTGSCLKRTLTIFRRSED